MNTVGTTMSQRLWDLDWAAELPWVIDGVRVQAGSLADWTTFLSERGAELYAGQDASRFLGDPLGEAKRRWAAEMDFFVLREGDRTVGVFMGQPSDWSTYYLRNTAILPEVRGRRLVPRLIGHIAETVARFGVERVQGEVAPTNLPSLRMLLGQGFVVTSLTNSERWGTCVELTKFLRAEAEVVFARQFCALRLGSAPPQPPRFQ